MEAGQGKETLTRKRRVLSLDGGGVKGYHELMALEAIETEFLERGGRLRGNSIVNHFDLVVGTSTGGLLAALLVLKGRNLEQAKGDYARLVKRIFSPQTWWEWTKSWFANPLNYEYPFLRKILGKEWHSSSNFEAMLRDYFGNMEMNDVGENGRKVALVSADLFRETAFLFRNYPRPQVGGVLENPEVPTLRVPEGITGEKVWKAARATSAAPTYFSWFPLVVEGQSRCLVDGGVGFNNPIFLARNEARFLWQGARLSFVSLGAGKPTETSWFTWISGHFHYPLFVSKMTKIATSTQANHTTFARETHQGIPYWRLNAPNAGDMKLGCIDEKEWEKARRVVSEYLGEQETREKIREIVDDLLAANDPTN